MWKKRLLLVFAAAAAVILAGCELFGIGSYTISGTITAHTFVPADSIGLDVFQWQGPGHGHPAPEADIWMSDPDASGYSEGTFTIRRVYPNLQGDTHLLVSFLSCTAPIGAFCRINGGQAESISGVPWRAEDQYCDYYIDYGQVTEPRDFTIDIDLGR